MRKENRGFTLIELVLAMAVTSLAFLMVIFLFQQGSRYYQSSKEELELQKEAQMAMNQLEQMILNSNQLELTTTGSGCQLHIRKLDTETKVVTEEKIVSFHAGDQKLLLSKKEGTTEVFTDRLMARWVKYFSVQFTSEEKNIVEITADFELNKKQYQLVQRVALRNRQAE